MSGTWDADQRALAEIHVSRIARRLGTEVYFTNDPPNWQASPTTRQVWVPEQVRPFNYLIALHELGHVASITATDWLARYPELGVEALVEGAAWAWATREADPALVEFMAPEDWVELAASLISYLRFAAYKPAPRRGAAAI